MKHIRRLIYNLRRLKRFFKKLNLEPVHLFFPSLLAVLAAFFEGVTFALLVPVIRGLIETNFEFAYTIKILSIFFNAFPKVFLNNNTAIFIFLVALVLIFSLLKNAFSYSSSLLVTYRVRKFSHELRCLIFNLFINFRKSYYDNHSVGSLQNILIGHTEQIALQFRCFQTVLYHLFALFAYLSVMLFISWKVTLFVIFLFPVLILVFKKLVSQIKQGSYRFSHSFSYLGKKIFNALSCIPLVKSYGAEDKERKWFDHISEDVRKHQVGMDIRMLLISPVQEVFFLICLLLLTGMMAYLSIRHSEGSVSAYLVFFALVRRAMTSLGTITSFQGNVASVVGPLREIVRVFEEREKWLEKKSGGKIASFQSEISFQNLSFEYTDRKILNGVSFSVKKGQMVAIVGRTGSGKSTIAQLLMRFYDPPKGSVLIDGQDILSLDLHSWRKKIAFISQENYFFDASIEDNLKYGCEVDPNADEMISALEKAQLGELLKKLPSGIVTEIGERGIQLSGGEKQRLSLARAILRDPEILILDEATNALDSQTEKLVQNAIDQVVHGRTSIVIAHRLTTIQKADCIFVLDQGKFVESGSFSDLIQAQGAFKLFWDSQRQSDQM